MSDGKLLHGQQYDPSKDIVVQYTERMHDRDSADAHLGEARTEVTPNDRDSSKVKIYGDATQLDSLVIAGPVRINLNLPDVMTAITVVHNEQSAQGNYVETNTAFSGGDHVDLSVPLQGNSQGNYNVMPDIIPTITPFGRPEGVMATRYFFYMTGPVTTATILARLAVIIGSPVLLIPNFKTTPITFVLTGQGCSVRSEAKCRQSVYISDDYNANDFTTGRGVSFDGSITTKVVTISPTLHPFIQLTNFLKEGKATTIARATIVGGTNFPPHDVTVTSETPLQRARVFPTSINATSPTTVPTTGLYLVDSDFSPDKEWGRTRVFAEVVDFAQFA